ncbi:uncharacterized protein LOC141647009 [Silene latifolia]|uniref:uncharacterized protein LOC141647009 n=1 Tax=Silene latifolia TaxID=37657 RepID=UPI003D780D83
MALPHLEGPLHGSTCVHLWPNLRTTMYYLDNQMIALKLCRTNSSLKCSTIPLAVSSYVAKRYPLNEAVDDEGSEHKDLEMHCEPSLSSDSHQKEGSHDSGKLDYHHFESVVTCSMKELRETLRRRRIGIANKGKVPWNKGRKHTQETCARIKERTLAAMRDPKVRRRMSEAPRTHSEQSKKKIGSSLKLLWAKRLKLKRSKEKFYYSWAESIAEAAKKGGIDEEQLCWDSYEIQKNEIACRRRQQNEKKAKEMVIQRIQAAKEQERAQNTASLAENKLDHRQHEGEPRTKQKGRSRKTRNTNKESIISSERSLKSRLTKIKEKKSVEESFRSHSGVMSDLHSALEKFDIESIKEEQKRKTMSLADQIQAAKSRRQR